MLLFDGPLTLREFMAHEELPLATVFREILLWLAGRKDAAVFGAQAVNAWVATTRMTEDVDVLSTDAAALGETLRAHLGAKFHIAARVREVVPGGFRVYQLRKPKNRHLVDIRQVGVLPEHSDVDGVPVLVPVELLAMKVESIADRKGREKGLSDRLDLHRLLNTFPDLRVADGRVAEILREHGVPKAVLDLWQELIAERIEPDEDDGY